jgi:hypothetical protein
MTAPVPEEARYCLMVPGETHPVETIPRDDAGFGAIAAVNRAQALSRDGAGDCSVYVGSRFLIRFINGRKVTP